MPEAGNLVARDAFEFGLEERVEVISTALAVTTTVATLSSDVAALAGVGVADAAGGVVGKVVEAGSGEMVGAGVEEVALVATAVETAGSVVPLLPPPSVKVGLAFGFVTAGPCVELEVTVARVPRLWIAKGPTDE